MQTRLQAFTQGRQQCEFCGGAAYSPLPGATDIIYACCGCRGRYARMVLETCSATRPDLLERVKNDIFYLDYAFDPEVERWGNMLVAKMKARRQQETAGERS